MATSGGLVPGSDAIPSWSSRTPPGAALATATSAICGSGRSTQSSQSADQTTTSMPRSRAWMKLRRFCDPYGGRNHRGGAPESFSSRSKPFAMCPPTRQPSRVSRVWSKPVKPHVVPLGEHPADELRVRFRAIHEHEEGGLRAVAGEAVEHARRGRRVGPVVEGQRDDAILCKRTADRAERAAERIGQASDPATGARRQLRAPHPTSSLRGHLGLPDSGGLGSALKSSAAEAPRQRCQRRCTLYCARPATQRASSLALVPRGRASACS